MKTLRERRKLWTIMAAVAVVVAVVGSLAYAANRPATAPLPPSGLNVTIWDTGFCSNTGNCGYAPTSKNVANGSVLTWTNTGGRPHTVTECTISDSSYSCPDGAGSNTSNTRAFDSNTQYLKGFGKDQRFVFTLDLSAGTYHYYCTLHPWMQGAIIVENSAVGE